MYQVTIFSNRLYVDENILDTDIINGIEDTIHNYNTAKFSYYNLAFIKDINKSRYEDILSRNSPHMYIKYKYGISDYYANSIKNLVDGEIKSQKSNNKNYIEDTKEKIKTVQDNLDKAEESLDDYLSFRRAFLKSRKWLKTNYNSYIATEVLDELNKFFRHLHLDLNTVLVSKPFGKGCDIYGWYEFEYKYLNPKIHEIKKQISGYKYRLNNLNNKLINLQKPKRSIFGTKKIMKDYSRGNCKRETLMNRKYKSFEVSGNNQAYYGNYVFKPTYNSDTNSLDFEITLWDGNIIKIPNIIFPYRQDELCAILTNNRLVGQKSKQRKPICFGIVRKYDHNSRCYYQIYASFDLQVDKGYINYDTSTGIVAIDFNYGHIDITELDGKGNLLYYKTIYYDLYFNSEMNEQSLRKALDEVGMYAKSKAKIIAVENINTYKSNMQHSRDKKTQKLLNYTLHRLPYKRYLEIVDYLRVKYELDVILVKPQFTSTIGKWKYSSTYKLPSHIAASYVIGRRALGFKDNPLSCFNNILRKKDEYIHKTNWSKWSYLDKQLSRLNA